MPIKDLILPESNVAVEMEDEFEACLDKALNILSEQGFTRELRQEQKCSVKQLFLLSSPLFLFFALAPTFARLKHRNLPRKRLLRRLQFNLHQLV